MYGYEKKEVSAAGGRPNSEPGSNTFSPLRWTTVSTTTYSNSATRNCGIELILLSGSFPLPFAEKMEEFDPAFTISQFFAFYMSYSFSKFCNCVCRGVGIRSTRFHKMSTSVQEHHGLCIERGNRIIKR